jgi:hypothetical protein
VGKSHEFIFLEHLNPSREAKVYTMSKKALLITFFLVIGFAIISFQAGRYIQNYKQSQEIGGINNELLSLLTRPSDLTVDDISWEQIDYRIRPSDLNKTGTSFMSGKRIKDNIDFLFIHEIVSYANGLVPKNNPSEYYSPEFATKPKVVFPGIEQNEETYCTTNIRDHLAECSVTFRDTKIISTFTIRIFEADDQIAFELIPAAYEIFVRRLKESGLKDN